MPPQTSPQYASDDNYAAPSPRGAGSGQTSVESDGFGKPKRGSGFSILVRHLNFTTTDDALKCMFEEYGEVRDVYIPCDYYSGRRRGFAFVEYVDEKSQEDACRDADGRELDGFALQVCKAERRRKTPDYYRQEIRRRDRYDGNDRYGDRNRRRRSESGSPRRDYGRPRGYDRQSPEYRSGRGREDNYRGGGQERGYYRGDERRGGAYRDGSPDYSRSRRGGGPGRYRENDSRY